MCVIVYEDVGVVEVYRYTKDGRWVKSGVKMDLLLTSIRLSRVSISFGLYGVVFLRFFLKRRIVEGLKSMENKSCWTLATMVATHAVAKGPTLLETHEQDRRLDSRRLKCFSSVES